MARPCATCTHEAQPSVDKDISAGYTDVDVAEKYGISRDSVSHHRLRHLNIKRQKYACKVCGHKDSDTINEMILGIGEFSDGELSYTRIREIYPELSIGTLSRHGNGCLGVERNHNGTNVRAPDTYDLVDISKVRQDPREIGATPATWWDDLTENERFAHIAAELAAFTVGQEYMDFQ